MLSGSDMGESGRVLGTLLAEIAGWRFVGAGQGPAWWERLLVRGFTEDSRRVRPGDLFVAVPGVSVDGVRFVPQALEQGAVAVMSQREPEVTPTVPWVVVPDARLALARLAAAWHGFPGRKMRVIGVTGTDGKTTTATLLHAALSATGEKVGLVTTVHALCGQQVWDTGLHTTTPDAPELQRLLAQILEQGASTLVLEATSHGLAQHRVDGSEFDVAVVTNITTEHLDYHGTWEAYRQAKGLLFQALGESGRKPGVAKIAVLNADDPSCAYLRGFPADQHWTYGLDQPADV
ncbi:MAG: hypothetical protein GX605_11030 [Chloroflexi bacterium]|nr:hypothetical protein [Chloroflexota bacterium]